MFSRRAKRDANQRLNERSLKASQQELPEAVEAEIDDRLVKLKRASAQLTAAAVTMKQTKSE